MKKNLRIRTTIILIVTLVALYYVFMPHNRWPSVADFSDRTQVAKNLADNIHLGLDLKGGIHLVLQVHTLEAVQASTDNDVQRVQTDLQAAGITSAAVIRAVDPAQIGVINITGVPQDKLGDARDKLSNSNAYGNCNCYANRDSHSYCDCHSYTNCDVDAYCQTHSYAEASSDATASPNTASAPTPCPFSAPASSSPFLTLPL